MTPHTGTATSDLQLPPRLHLLPQSPHLDIPQTVQGHQEALESGGTPSYLVISGGTGCNAICAAFALNACYVLPVSDNGGSSSEIIRVLGGPSIGDIRSRLLRLTPPAPPRTPLDALRTLLAHRLPSGADAEQAAREEWRTIVEGKSHLWAGIPEDRKETIRGTGHGRRFSGFENEILRRAHKNFSFVNGSIGNFLLAAAQSFFRSLPSAIFLFSSITNSQANIVPVITTNHTVTIAAELTNGTHLVGQCEISHPVARPVSLTDEDENNLSFGFDTISPTVSNQTQNVLFGKESKDSYERLRAPINRLYYINAYGHEIHPAPNPEYSSGLGTHQVLVYSCGSLWTSIIPCLALRGVATAIARSRSLRAKVLFLNAKNDRETEGYTAADHIRAIARTLNARYQVEPYGLGPDNAATTYPVSTFVTHMVHLRDCAVHVDVALISDLGVRCVEAKSNSRGADGIPLYDAACAKEAMDLVLGDVCNLTA